MRSKEWGRFVRRQRLSRKESQEAFGGHFGIGGAYVSGWEVHGKVPAREIIERGVAALGGDLQEWLRLAGVEDDLGGIVGEEVSAPEPLTTLPILGGIDEHGIIGFGPAGPPDMEGALRFALRAEAASPGAFIQAGDVVHFEVCDTAKRNDHVLIEEADGTRRLVRLVSSDPENRAVRVLPIDAPALPKPIRIEARIVARLTALLKV